ncbi:MAG: GxxExxY protein [Ginsengibacter sp.]
MAELLFKDESYKITRLCMEIHHTLGMGLKEINYKDAMEIEFNEHKIPFERENRFTVIYKGKELCNPYLADFMVYDSINLELNLQLQ